MKTYFLLAVSILLLQTPFSYAQIPSYQHHTERDKNNEDTTTLQYFFRNGNFYGHARYYFMATDNTRNLKDFYANAFGMGIGYETRASFGFQIGISGFFINNLASTDFLIPDPTTGARSRYELGQFDVLRPANKHDMDRLEDFYFKYTFRKSSIKYGKQHIRTPFINPQDGRMRPTLVDGILAEFNEIKNTKIEAGWIYKISPRSTVDWFKIGPSMSIFPSGVGVDGKPSAYPGNIYSDGVYYLGLHHHLFKTVKIQVWDMVVSNVLNSFLAQADAKISLNKEKNIHFIAGAQYIRQDAINNGGNEDQLKTYVLKNNIAETFGGRLGLSKEKNWIAAANFNYISNQGRYLMPREWGRDPFYTFMPRERNEGNADVMAISGSFMKNFPQKHFKFELSAGQFFMPEATDAVKNKYGMPSYWQLNADLRYQFQGFMKGLEMQLLYVYKGNAGNTYGNDRFVINKVDMSLYNLILNYHF
jgi:hypothetical protein